MKSKYTLELLEPIVKECTGYSCVCRRLNINHHGGNIDYIKKMIIRLGIDTSNFLGYAHCKGKPSNHRKTALQILIEKPVGAPREKAYKLKRALIEIGRPYKCEECSIGDIWNGKPLSLQIDHKNGVVTDDKPENIRFMCHNCHSQTENFCAKKTALEKRKNAPQLDFFVKSETDMVQ